MKIATSAPTIQAQAPKRFDPRPTPAQVDQFRRNEEAAQERWSGNKLGTGLLVGGLAGAGLGGTFAAIANPSLGLTVPGSAIICGCLGAGIGGCVAMLC